MRVNVIGWVAAAAVAATWIGSGIGAAQAQSSTLGFAGVDARERSYYGYVGVRHHFSGDMTTDGFLLRAVGLYGAYDYDSTAVAGGEVDADVISGDAEIGYQKIFGGVALRAYAGVEYEDHDLSPNNSFDSNEGSDVGVRLQGEIETDFFSPYYGNLIVSYGGAKERLWARLRGGYNLDGYIFGPEAQVSNNEESTDRRLGAFVMVPLLAQTGVGPLGLSVSAGYSDTSDRRGGASPYGNLELAIGF